MLKKLIREAEKYESGKMLRSDSEIAIASFDGKVWICDYSESREDFVPVMMVCDEGDIEVEDIIKACNVRHWSYCMRITFPYRKEIQI